MSSGSSRKCVGASAFAAGRASHRCDFHRSAHGEALVQRQARRLAAGDRLTAQGFTLIGGRLDYIDARAIGAVVYKRRQHLINLFVSQTASTEKRSAKIDTVQGFNIRHWSERGLNYWAVSDLAKDELADFGERFESASRAPG